MRSESQYRGYRPDDMLTPAAAAALARRSVRTIRRAYGSGALIAYRDGSGRSVRIRYADLQDWLMSEPAASPARRAPTLSSAPPAFSLARRHAHREPCAAARRPRGSRPPRRRFLVIGLNGSAATAALASLHSRSRSIGSLPW